MEKNSDYEQKKQRTGNGGEFVKWGEGLCEHGGNTVVMLIEQ